MITEAEAMQAAILAAREGIKRGEGGPFGAVIVCNGELIAQGNNRVLALKDATCHAEIEAIRRASCLLQTHILSGCTLYTTAEPCPMCLGAIYWSRISRLVIGVSQEVASEYGFDDAHFYREMTQKAEHRSLPTQRGVEEEACGKLFSIWKEEGGVLY